VLLRIFRVNDPYRLLGIFVTLVLISLALFLDPAALTLNELKSFVLGELLNDGKNLYSEVFTSTPPLAAWFFGWIELAFGRSITARHSLAFLLIFFQGAYFAILLINHKAQNESTYLPALIFGVLCFFSFDMLSLSAELIASTFLLFALNNLFKEVEFRIQRDSIVLNLGVFLGVASLFVLSYVVFLLGTLIILGIFTRLTIRKTLLLFFGFMLPHALLMVVYFMKGDFVFLANNFYRGHEWFSENLMSLSALIYLSSIPIIYFIFSLVMLNREARLTKYQSQLLQIMFLWLVVAIIEIVVAGNMSPQRVITYAPPLAYFTSHFLLLIRRKWLGELMIWIFIGGIVLLSYLSRYEKLTVVDYTQLFYKQSMYDDQLKNKRVLILGNDWGLFEANRMASGFMEWSLTQNIFSESDYFENVVLIDRLFQQDPPQIIVDKQNLMTKVIDRIPRLRKEYKQQGELYFRVVK
jgi:Family of unknown function (DUF6427)